MPIDLDQKLNAPRRPLPLDLWVDERLENSLRIAAMKSGTDRAGWLEDAWYWQQVRAAFDLIRYDPQEKALVRMFASALGGSRELTDSVLESAETILRERGSCQQSLHREGK